MTETSLVLFDQVNTVVRDPLRFKYKLDIGEDAYQSLRLKKHLLDAIDAGNGALVGFGAAKSSLIASTFFAPSGFLGAIGVTSAATPVGWAIAAGVVGAGLSLAIGKHLVRGSSSQVRSIPDCINTPMDVLAVGLFDLIGTLALKLASTGSQISTSQKAKVTSYFVNEWGYDQAFVDVGLAQIEKEIDTHSLNDIAEQLANFKKRNPDCNYATMAREIVEFLHELSAVDGIAGEKVDENVVIAIDEVQAIFAEVERVRFGVLLSDSIQSVTMASKRAVDEASIVAVDATNSALELARQTVSTVSEKINKNLKSKISEAKPKSDD